MINGVSTKLTKRTKREYISRVQLWIEAKLHQVIASLGQICAMNLHPIFCVPYPAWECTKFAVCMFLKTWIYKDLWFTMYEAETITSWTIEVHHPQWQIIMTHLSLKYGEKMEEWYIAQMNTSSVLWTNKWWWRSWSKLANHCGCIQWTSDILSGENWRKGPNTCYLWVSWLLGEQLNSDIYNQS